MARKRKRGTEQDGSERWLITYADLITLLLIFFIIMYSMSQIDAAKYETLARTLRMEFNVSDTILPNNAGIMGSADRGKGDEGETTGYNSDEELQDLMKTVQQFILDNNIENEVSVADTRRGIAVTLKDLFLFDLGKAELKPEASPLLDKLASLFPTLNVKVSIEGHTDNLPLATGAFYIDNWGLSNARSLSVLRHFIYNAKLDEKQFISTGYADTKPVAANDSVENRQKNRRVEIVIMR